MKRTDLEYWSQPDEITMFGFCDFHIIGLFTNITPISLTKSIGFQS